MKFTRLRLSGFKSFVDPTELRIEPGLTGVVGPNGCGKSNLLEALRWVMGEASARSLRGGAMDDVIFAGTARRPARHHADVSLLLDNSGRTAPAAWNDDDELEVSRRIERDDGSTYRINGREVRQKDVQLLFADAASGAQSNALVSQGRVGAIVTAKPAERRAVLEEAAGIAGLHGRRREAELRLQAAEANLARLDDVIVQMAAQLTQLERQSRQAARYRAIAAELRVAEAMLLYRRWREAADQHEACEAALRALSGEVAGAAHAAAEAATRHADLAARLPALRADEAEAAARWQHIRRALDQNAAERQRVASRLAELALQSEALVRDHQREAGLIADAESSLAALAAEQSEVGHRLAEATAQQARADAEVSAAETDTRDAERRFDSLTQANADALAQRRALEGRQRDAEQRIRQIEAEAARLAEQFRACDQATDATAEAEAAKVAADAEAVAARLAGEQGAAEIEREQALDALEQLRQQQALAHSDLTARLRAERDRAAATLEATRTAATREIAAAQSTLNALAAERLGLERLLESARPSDGAPALDAVAVAPGWEAALGAALGEDLSAAIGGATGRRWLDAPRAVETQALPDAVAPLSRHVEAPAALALRLSQIGVVEDAAAGDRLAWRLAPGQRLVSRDGLLWRWDGYRADSPARAEMSERLAQRNRLAALERELDAAARAMKRLETAHNGAITRDAALLSDVEAAARTALAAASAGDAEALQSARARADAAQTVERDLRQARQRAEAERERLRRALDRQQAAERERRLRLAALEQSRALLGADQERCAAELSRLREALAAIADTAALATQLTEQRRLVERRRETLATARAQHSMIARQVALDSSRDGAITRDRAGWSARRESATQQCVAIGERQSANAAERAALAAQPQDLINAADALERSLAEAQTARQAASAALAQAEDSLRRADLEARQAADLLAGRREERARTQAQTAALDERQADAARAILDAHQCSPAQLPEQARFDPDAALAAAQRELDARVERLRQDRERLGAVNLLADQERAALDAERSMLAEERAELETAIAKLRGSIGALNREGRARLLAAFDRVNGHFTSLFTTLFGGGAAHLALVDSDDPLEAGLEIMASPPGKKLQALSLLSGGEQALTACALIFAIFLTNPAPVCVLDEVDAPLDDANVERFCALIGDITRRTGTRFLVVTHNALTMSRMDRLYGVTMAERGVSQLVSVDLGHAELLLAAE